IIVGGGTMALILLGAQVTSALTREQINTCRGNAGIAPDGRIEACSAIIDGTRSSKLKAEAYTQRGNAYRARSKYDLAIADFDQAISLDGKNADAYYNRGLTFRDRGETDRAVQDLEQSVIYN